MKNSVNRENPSQMAEGIAMQRFGESNRAVDERLCYDPYAIHFIRPEIIEFGLKHPEEAKAKIEETEKLFPGLSSSIMVRVRYFDDFVEKLISEGIEQLVILGAGYDTRPYRLECLNDIKVFEVDHPNTQSFKIEKIKEIFGSIPENVTYVSIDFEIQDLGQLLEKAYDSSKKTLFVLEGLVMYIPPKAVVETLKFIADNSPKGSGIIFDYYPESVVNGTCKFEVGHNIRNHLITLGEPLQFGINENEIEDFLSDFGFSHIKNITSQDYKKMYFKGKNQKRDVCGLLYFVHAEI